MAVLVEPNSLSRQRVLLGILGLLLGLATLVRLLAAETDNWSTRLIASMCLVAFALFAHRLKFFRADPGRGVYLAILPYLLHTSFTTYAGNLSTDSAIVVIFAFMAIGAVIESRQWLGATLASFAVGLLAAAQLAAEPQMSPLTFSMLIVMAAVVVFYVGSQFHGARRRLRKALQELEEAQQFARVGTWECKLPSGETHWSATAREILGYKETAAVPQFHQMLLNGPETDALRTDVLAFLGNQGSYAGIGEVATRSGDTIWLHSRGKTFYENDRPVRKYGVFLDITEQRLREAALEAATVEAEHAAAARARFLANMSHEIRTPLNGVLGMAALLDDEPLGRQARASVETIRNCGESLLATINDILDFSKLDAGAVQLEERPFRVSELVEKSVSVVRKAIEDKDLRLLTPSLAEDPTLLGDELRLQQVLVNLLSNACKFTERGSIGIECQLALRADGQVNLRLDVIDTGVGMAPDAVEKLFSPFTQADSSTTRRYGGTGLGLSICKQLLEAMGGSIAVASVEGQGTTFTAEVTLPVTTPVDVSAATAPKRGSVRARKVLVAEDNPVNQTVARRLLERQGCEVVLVDDGRQAVDAVAAADYDLVFMDVNMPELDGVSATRLIRENRTIRQPTIFALTAGVMEDEQSRCLEAGMNGFLAKPIREEALAAALAQDRDAQRHSNPA